MTNNPYAPPESPTSFEGLPADTEFLVSDKCILCGDEVTLPRVCVVTGGKVDVVPQQAVLKWTPRSLYVVRLFMLVLLLPALSSLPFALQTAASATLPNAPAIIVCVVLAGNVLSWCLAFHFARRANLTWYVDAGIQRRKQDRRRFWKRASLLGVVLMGTAIVGGFNFHEGLLAAVAPFGLGTVLCVSKFKSGHDLQLAGQHQGLNILTGMSPSFLQAVNAMIEGHQS